MALGKLIVASQESALLKVLLAAKSIQFRQLLELFDILLKFSYWSQDCDGGYRNGVEGVVSLGICKM